MTWLRAWIVRVLLPPETGLAVAGVVCAAVSVSECDPSLVGPPGVRQMSAVALTLGEQKVTLVPSLSY